MTREEKAALAFVAAEVVIIVLLLLVDQAPTVTPQTIKLGDINIPGDSVTLNITTRPPDAFPLDLNFPPNPYDPVAVNAGSNPCACGCDGSGGLTIPGASIDQSFIDQINAAAKGGLISQVQQYFSTLPGDVYFLTNNTRVSQFETFW